jgi:hypothetical protein
VTQTPGFVGLEEPALSPLTCTATLGHYLA